jgi:hypothetical protein
VTLPESFVLEKFYQWAGYPRFKKTSNTYEAGCPVCKEGSSWGRKRRLYYLPKDSIMCCHNCGWYGNPVKWVMEVEGLTFRELVHQVEKSDNSIDDIDTVFKPDIEPTYTTPPLPEDSIDLLDPLQIEYYKDNKIVRQAIDYIESRRLNTAVNRPAGIYISLADKIHRNRICFPSYDRSGKVQYYQTRTFLPKDDRPKYLSKFRADRDVFGVSNVTDILPYVYIFEGPVDSFFVENAVAIYGIQEKSRGTLTPSQADILDSNFLFKRTWVLDNQRLDQASMSKTKKLLEQGERVFIWPESLKQYKDFNEICMHFKLDEISSKLIDDNTHCIKD